MVLVLVFKRNRSEGVSLQTNIALNWSTYSRTHIIYFLPLIGSFSFTIECSKSRKKVYARILTPLQSQTILTIRLRILMHLWEIWVGKNWRDRTISKIVKVKFILFYLEDHAVLYLDSFSLILLIKVRICIKIRSLLIIWSIGNFNTLILIFVRI